MSQVCWEMLDNGKIAYGPENIFALQTIDFVQKQLPKWRDDPNRPKATAENKLNEQLHDFLNTKKCQDEFPMARFCHEASQTGRSRVDLAAKPTQNTIIEARHFTVYDAFLVFECKRLPPDRKSREKEYVTGIKKKSGGIQRFKLGLHGADLSIAAMIGYIQKSNSKEWHKKINSWIHDLSNGKVKDGCTWKKSETLESFKEDITRRTAVSRSVHNRTGSKTRNTIELCHLWVEMSKK